jgi:hypothetical protein
MAIEDKVFSGDTLRSGYRFQRHWDNSMAYAFIFAELGAGIYFVSLLMNSVPGMVVGLILVSTGKPYFHLAHMGVPSRSWRAMLRPDRSWISRGLLGLGAMIGAGFLYVIALTFGEQLGIGADSGLLSLLKVASAAFAIVVMCYQGFAMSHSSAIGIWNSAIIPMASLLYSLSLVAKRPGQRPGRHPTAAIAGADSYAPDVVARGLARKPWRTHLGRIAAANLLFQMVLGSCSSHWHYSTRTYPAGRTWQYFTGDYFWSCYAGRVLYLADTDFQDWRI